MIPFCLQWIRITLVFPTNPQRPSDSMKNITLHLTTFSQPLAALVALTLIALTSPVVATDLPQRLLETPIHLTSGETVTLAQYKSKKPVYLKFWATWCQPCRKEMPHLAHIQAQYGDSIEVIAINLGINDQLNDVVATQHEFGLTMPMAMDTSGDLAQAFHLLGTPYHLLFDQQMNLVHVGNAANEQLDTKIALVARQKPIDLIESQAIAESAIDLSLDLENGKIHALFFTATWCDWYLKDSRPLVSKNCATGQQNINKIYKQFPNINWQGVISRLWTADKDLIDYKKKYSITHPLTVDESNGLFHRFNVKKLPTLLFVKDGKVILKVQEFGTVNELNQKLQREGLQG